MSSPAGRIADLAADLHSLDRPLDELPVRGYRPPDGAWHPRPAAVLVAIWTHPEPAVLLTVRSRDLPHHAGQVSLPGGGRQHDEPFPLGTALRETAEEVGIDDRLIEPIGLLDRFDTITGYRVVPVVGLVHGDPQPVPCPNEVESVFMLPWHVVSRPQTYRRHQVLRGKHRYELVSMATAPRLVWGATAAILRQFTEF
jgi:8-oxo-dGTP pyrophosphatase MutT (NUDIX family)